MLIYSQYWISLFETYQISLYISFFDLTWLDDSVGFDNLNKLHQFFSCLKICQKVILLFAIWRKMHITNHIKWDDDAGWRVEKSAYPCQSPMLEWRGSSTKCVIVGEKCLQNMSTIYTCTWHARLAHIMHISLDGNVVFAVVSVLRMLFTFAFVMLMKRIVTDTEYSTCMHTQCKFSCATAAAAADAL